MAAHRDTIVPAVTAVDADLDPDVVGVVVDRVTPHREQRRLLATAVSSDRGWCAGSVTAPVSVERLVIGLAGLGSGRFEPPLGWLRHHGRPFAELAQADIDLWVTIGPPGRRCVRAFLSWAAARKLAARVTVPGRPHQLPSSAITAREVQAFVHRLATDGSIPTVERTAGLLVALKGQPATRLVRLRLEHVTINRDQVTLRLGRHHVELPPVLAGLVVELVTDRPRRGVGAPGVNPWLFPGGHPGRPLTAGWLAARITTHGLPVAELRAAALLELAAELPAAFLADLLGISAGTAVRWTHAAGGEWARYAARARTTRR